MPLVAGLVLAGCSTSTTSPAREASTSPSSSVEDSYGALPTFLPTIVNHADEAVTGVPGRPAVTSQGDVVVARIGTGSVQAVIVGPDVPGEGLPHVTSATTCTWTVTFDHATTAVPLRLNDFLTVDELGHRYQLHYVPGSAQPPGVLQPNRSTTFKLRAVMATGEGVMRWQPDGHALAVWDFVVEND